MLIIIHARGNRTLAKVRKPEPAILLSDVVLTATGGTLSSVEVSVPGSERRERVANTMVTPPYWAAQRVTGSEIDICW